MPFYLGIMTLPKSLVVVPAVLMLCVLSSCSIQKRTTFTGWHVEKAPSLFHQIGGPSSSLTPAVKPEPLALQRLDRLPPRALSWTTRQAPMDTSVVYAKVKRQVKRALRREIQTRKRMLMYPQGLGKNINERVADELHAKAVRQCLAQGKQLNELAPEEFAQLEHLQNPSCQTQRALKVRKFVEIVGWIVLAAFAFFLIFFAVLLSNYQGG